MFKILSYYNFIDSNIEFGKISIRNTFLLLFHDFDVIICAIKFLYNKTPPLGFFRVSFDIINVLVKILFIFFGIRRKSKLILNSTHIDGFNSSFSIKFNGNHKRNRINNILWNFLWSKSLSLAHGFNVYSSLIKKEVVSYVNKPVFVAPNAVFRYAQIIYLFCHNQFHV